MHSSCADHMRASRHRPNELVATPLHRALGTRSDDKIYVTRTIVDPHTLAEAEIVTLTLPLQVNER